MCNFVAREDLFVLQELVERHVFPLAGGLVQAQDLLPGGVYHAWGHAEVPDLESGVHLAKAGQELDAAVGQFLHLVFLVETFLRNLCSRGSKFDVFFFDSNKALFRQHSASFALARAAVLYHVKSHESKLPFKVHIVEGSWVNVTTLGSWRELIDSLRPTFVMSNAGPKSGNLSILAVAQMAFVHNHLVAGHNVVKFDNLTFDGSRVWAFLYNLPDVACSRVLRDFYDRLWAHGFADLFETQNEGGEGTQMCPDSSDLRTRLYLSSLSRVLDVCGQNPRARGLAMICLGCLEMMQVLPLDRRAFVLPQPAEKEDSSSSSVSKNSCRHSTSVAMCFQM